MKNVCECLICSSVVQQELFLRGAPETGASETPEVSIDSCEIHFLHLYEDNVVSLDLDELQVA